jgi:seryl-tRNA synthetase
VDDIREKYLKILQEVEKLRAAQNQIKGKPTLEELEKAKAIKVELKEKETLLKEAKEKLDSVEMEKRNTPAADVPIGKSEEENQIIKTVGEIPKFDFTPKDHLEIGESLDILDVKKASIISGSRFAYFKGRGAELEFALMYYAFRKLIKKGFIGMIPPSMVKSNIEAAMGYTNSQNLDNAYYALPQDDLILISSSEHSVVPYHIGETMDSKKLPIKYVNFSTCFRREAGTYGKDTRGLLRVHNFNKVEMNVFTLPDEKISDKMCEEMLVLQEELISELGLPYQIVKNCTGDLPVPNRRMYDINCWFPGQNKYREITSCSNCTDYQAKRLKIKNAHILNATVAVDRMVLAIIENYQKPDGTFSIPPILLPILNL